MEIYKSRFTPNAKATEIKFSIGDVVKYKLRSGQVMDITIDSEPMSHSQCAFKGYEAIFSDNGQRSFAGSDGIIDWQGKC
jgi:hypothetical protein